MAATQKYLGKSAITSGPGNEDLVSGCLEERKKNRIIKPLDESRCAMPNPDGCKMEEKGITRKEG